MSDVRQLAYDVPAQIREEVYISEKAIDRGNLSWDNIRVYLHSFWVVGLPLAFAGLLIDLVSPKSSENFLHSNTVMFVSALFCILLVIMIGRFVVAKRAANRLDRLVDVLSYELDDWLMKNHRIFLDDDRLEEISVNFLDSVESVQFVYGGITCVISQTVTELPGKSEKSEQLVTSESADVVSENSDDLVEKVRHIWSPALNSAYERVSKTIKDLENMGEDALSLEEQHCVSRAHLNLNEIMQLTVRLSLFDKMKDEDAQKIMNMLFVMNDELTRIYLDRADVVRKELDVLHTVIVERSDSSTNSIKLSFEE